MSKPGRDDRITFTQMFLAGGFAGVVSRTATSPLDVVKILSQVGTKETQSGFLRTFTNLYRNEGLRAFWKGNGVAAIRLFPYNAVQFAAFHELKLLFSDEEGYLDPVDAMIAGALGGVAATAITYPTDLVKTRLTVANVNRSHGLWGSFRTIYKEEGFRAFYRGMGTSIAGVIPFAGGTFMAYEILDEMWDKPKDKMTFVENFLDGCVAAAFAQTFSFPFDTIRKKLQAQSVAMLSKGPAPEVIYEGMWDAFRKTVRQHGFLGLWRGTLPNLVKVTPYAGIMFMVFEASKRGFLWQNGYTESPFVDKPRVGVPQDLKPHQLKVWLSEHPVH